MVKDVVDQTVPVAAPVSALETSSHAPVSVFAATGPASSLSCSSVSNALVDSGPVFLTLGDPSGWSAVERSPDCDCVLLSLFQVAFPP